jgi:hypothetical protein
MKRGRQRSGASLRRLFSWEPRLVYKDSESAGVASDFLRLVLLEISKIPIELKSNGRFDDRCLRQILWEPNSTVADVVMPVEVFMWRCKPRCYWTTNIPNSVLRYPLQPSITVSRRPEVVSGSLGVLN